MKKIFTFLVLSLSLFLVSCTAEATLELKSTGQISISFTGATGEAFTKMISAAVGEKDGMVFDTKEIGYELAKSGFTKVKATSKTGKDVFITMEDEKQKSYLFRSGVVSVVNNSIEMNLNKKSVVNFYNMADEQIVAVLDLLLAPVFNDEVMSETEYLETLSAFYGQNAADELQSSNLKVTLIAPDGSKKIHTIPFATILTL